MGARGSRFRENRFPLCLTALASTLLPLSFTLSKLCSQFTSDQVSALRFYANPMPMSCHRRGKPLPLPSRDRRGFHFPRSVPFLPPSGLFQGNHFPSPSASVLGTLYRSYVSLRSPLSFPIVYRSLSSLLFFSPLLCSPLLCTTILSLVTQP